MSTALPSEAALLCAAVRGAQVHQRAPAWSPLWTLESCSAHRSWRARAARAMPEVHMNALLLKPERDTHSQVVLLGRVVQVLSRMPWRTHCSAPRRQRWILCSTATPMVYNSVSRPVFRRRCSNRHNQADSPCTL